ncbi:MAG: DeoR/GlpR family DNA-binding transcription regulator [Anaerolineaceae bacterium]
MDLPEQEKQTKSKVETRREFILTELKNNGHESVSNLARKLGVSDSTIKRDFNALVKDESIKRTHGGAFIETDGEVIRIRTPFFKERQTIHEEEKRRIAQRAAELIQDGDTIFLDTGSTINMMVENITAKNITIITNSIAVVISALSSSHKLNIQIVSGEVDFDHLILSGSQQIELLSCLFFDKAFISCRYVSPERGITVLDYDEKIVKNILIKNSRETILCADTSKIGKTGKIIAVPFNQISYFVTDNALSEQVKDSIQKAGTTVLCV